MICPDELVTHMPGVQATERDLRDLGVVWRVVESSAAISCPDEVASILPTLENTRERFDALRQRLVAKMVLEHQAALADALAAKAQCAIDILVRNLYERTADVGFLATDEVVRSFCAAPERPAALHSAMVERLAAYQAKYTVYDDIVLLSPQGAVLARLDSQATVPDSRDSVVAEALACDGYVERFRCSDLGASTAAALLYAHRVTEAGRAVGVLVLRFRFADEMQRIFSSINPDNAQGALMLVDAQQRVVASNDDAHVPTGALLATLQDTALQLTVFAGREYLAVCRASAGYQGYSGPAWRAQAMVSLPTAFRQRGAETSEDSAVPLDNSELVAMNRDADAINRELRRVVWNGRLMAGSQGGEHARLKAVLKQVNQTGLRTHERVAQAIQGIHRTSLARARRQTHELARLAADIMDRNLYERANDCRWWALSPVLRQGLAQPQPDSAALCQVLDNINSLYTVYSRLVVFDTQGVVQGVSHRSTGEGLIGSGVPAGWLQAVAHLGDAQTYAVSAFEDTALHDRGPTYVYLAAVHDVHGVHDSQRLVGGIAFVFNAAAELAAMLHDVMAGRSGFDAFVDGQGRVLAATDPALAAGLVPALQQPGAVLEHDGTHYACARLRASGYREFKSSDGHDTGVHAVVGLRLGAHDRRQRQLGELDLSAGPVVDRSAEMALFQVGGSRYALPTASVMEAISIKSLVPTPGGSTAQVGLTEVPGAGRGPLVPVLCARRLFGVTYAARDTDGTLLIIRCPQHPAQAAYALRVDDVLSVLDIPTQCLHAAPQGFGRFAPWVTGIADCQAVHAGRSQSVLVQVLDPARLAQARLGVWDDAAAQPADEVSLID